LQSPRASELAGVLLLCSLLHFFSELQTCSYLSFVISRFNIAGTASSVLENVMSCSICLYLGFQLLSIYWVITGCMWFEHHSLCSTHANAKTKCNSLDGITMFNPWLLCEVGVLGGSLGWWSRRWGTDLVLSGMLCLLCMWYVRLLGRTEL
jgi:hypothetical protein